MTFTLSPAIDTRTAVQIANLARHGFAAEIIAETIGSDPSVVTDALLAIQTGGIPLPLIPNLPSAAERPAVIERAHALLATLRGPYTLVAVPRTELMTIAEVARAKRVPTDVVDAAYWQGDLPAILDPEVHYRFWRADVDRWRPPEQEREPIIGEAGIVLALVRRGYSPIAIATSLGYQRSIRPLLTILAGLAQRAVPVPPIGSYGTTEIVREEAEIASLLPTLRAQLPEEWYPYTKEHRPPMTVLTADQIRAAHESLVRGARWSDIQPSLNISRQRFDLRRKELGLPPPREARKAMIASEHDLMVAPTEVAVRTRRAAEGWLTLSVAAGSLGIRPETLAAQVRHRQIAAESEGGRTWVRATDVETYRENHRRQRGGAIPEGFHSTTWYEKQYGVTKAILYEERRKEKLAMERWGSSWIISEAEFMRWYTPRAARKERRATNEEIRGAYAEMERGRRWSLLSLAQRISWTTFVRRVKQLEITPFWETITDDDIRDAHAQIRAGHSYAELPRFICMAYSTFTHRTARLGLPPLPIWETPDDDRIRAVYEQLAAGASWQSVGMVYPVERFMERVMALGLSFDAVQEEIMVALGSAREA